MYILGLHLQHLNLQVVRLPIYCTTYSLYRYRNHLTFLMRCRDNKIIPKGLRLKTTVKSNKAHRITMRAGLALLRERIGDARRKKVWLRKQLETVRIDLSKTTTLDVERGVNQWAERHAVKTHLLCQKNDYTKRRRNTLEKEDRWTRTS